MEIERQTGSDTLVLNLRGKFDATWSGAVDDALAAAVRDGHHRLALDMTGVDYISSAGLRVLLSHLKQLKAIHGEIGLRNVQPVVAKVLELSGLGALFSSQVLTAAPDNEAIPSFRTENAEWERRGLPNTVNVRVVGGSSAFETGAGEFVEFLESSFGLGVGAIADCEKDAAPRLGEFLAAGGCAAHLPPGGSNRADFVVREGGLIPGAWLTSGLVADAIPELLLRFEADAGGRIGLGEISRVAVDAAGGPAAFVMIAETAGLVGASLRQPPGEAGDPFSFPAVRERLDFTAERAFRDSVTVVIGFAAPCGSQWDAWLRPATKAGGLLAHAHGAVFPYFPIRKGAVALVESVRGLFDTGGARTVLHLLLDSREPDGAGESEFFRGACWVAGVKTP